MSDDADGKRLSRGPVEGRLNDKVALVSGAAGGQGQVVALLFAQAGATVFASDINAAGMEQTAAMAKERGLSINIAAVDVSSPQESQDWVADAVKACGRVDVLYNNGAGLHVAPFEDMTVEQWRETLRLELDVIFMPTKAVWPIMKAQNGGSIINIASGAGMLAGEGMGTVAHSAGKGGVISVTRALSLEGGPHGIRVNSISPGPIMTPGSRRHYEASPGFRRLFDCTCSLDRHGFPIDVAYAGVFLASDESMFITGINLPVDGGSTSHSGVLLSKL